MYWVRQSRTFWRDHSSRCVSRSVAEKSSAGLLYVELEGFEVANLLSDADHWRTEWRAAGKEWIGLGQAARFTCRTIRGQFDPEELEGFAAEWREIEEAAQAARVEGGK